MTGTTNSKHQGDFEKELGALLPTDTKGGSKNAPYFSSKRSILLPVFDDNYHLSGLFASAASLNLAAAVPVEDAEVLTEDFLVPTTQGQLTIKEVGDLLEKDPSQRTVLFSEEIRGAIKRKCFLRTCLTAFYLTLGFVGYLGVQNAMPSLGGDQQLSMFTWAAYFAGQPLAAFIPAFLTYRVGTKWTYLVHITPFAAFPLAMYYRSYFTTLPLAAMCGMGTMIWINNDSAYMKHLGTLYSLSSGLDVTKTFSIFKGITVGSFFLSSALGNLLTSLILGNVQTSSHTTSFDSDDNSTSSANVSSMPAVMEVPTGSFSELNISCGLSYVYQKKLLPPTADIKAQYILFGVLAAIATTGWLLLISAAENVKIKSSKNTAICQSIIAIGKALVRPKSFPTYPLGLMFGFNNSIILVDYITAYVSCPYGISNAGLVIMIGTLASAAGSLSSGPLLLKLGRIPTYTIAIGVLISAYVGMLYFQPLPSFTALAFVPEIVSSVSQGMFVSLHLGLITSMQPKDTTPAICAFQMFVAIGSVVGSLTIARGWLNLQTKLYIIIVLAVASHIAVISSHCWLQRQRSNEPTEEEE